MVELGARQFVADWDLIGAMAYDPAGEPPCFRLKPDVQTHYEGWLRPIPRTRIRVNADRMRGPETPKTRQKGRMRVALVGDSHVFGLGVEEQDTIGAALAIELGRGPTLTTAPEVLNFGVPGYDFTGMVKRVDEDVPAFCPDVVAIFLCADDLDEPSCGRFSHANSPLRHLALGRLWLASRRPKRQPGQAPMEQGRLYDLLRTVRMGIGEDTGLVVVKMCPLGSPELEEHLALHVGALRGELIDASASFSALSKDLDRTAIRYDGHLNGAGNRAWAEVLANKLAPILDRHRDVGQRCAPP